MKKIILLAAFAAVMSVADMAAQKVTTQRTPAPDCMGVELDGSQTLRAYGSGRNRKDAIEQARKNAVYAVVFDGIRNGVSGCDQRPLINEPNAREKYEDYFNAFFRDGGDYKNYVTSQDQRAASRNRDRSRTFVNFAVTVRVLRGELKARLREDGILK